MILFWNLYCFLHFSGHYLQIPLQPLSEFVTIHPLQAFLITSLMKKSTTKILWHYDHITILNIQFSQYIPVPIIFFIHLFLVQAHSKHPFSCLSLYSDFAISQFHSSYWSSLFQSKLIHFLSLIINLWLYLLSFNIQLSPMLLHLFEWYQS